MTPGPALASLRATPCAPANSTRPSGRHRRHQVVDTILSPLVQAKLRISPAHDSFEAEADREANKLAATPHTRADAGADSTPQSARRGNSASLVSSALGSSGRPLDPVLRSTMERHFDRDLGDVRVHTGARAAHSARGIQARAYTLGRDIVFGAGEYATHSTEGRKLLAHEVTHVVQQGDGRVGPSLQRKLFVTGRRRHVSLMLDLLQSASGLSLAYDPKTNTVSATGFVPKPRSSVLALRLEEIINDPARHARINLGENQRRVSVGAFPTDLTATKLIQEVRIDHILALEQGVPGYGIAKLAHEITENYEAELHRDDRFAFDASHAVGEETENLVARELIGPGLRRSTFGVEIKKRGRRLVREIADVENYFVVSETPLDGDKISNVRRVPRVSVAQFRINSFDPSAASLPSEVDATLSKITTVMKREPTASAHIEVRSGKQPRPGAPRHLPALLADRVQQEVIDRTGNVLVTNWRRFDVDIVEGGETTQVTITLDRPDLP